MSLHSVWQVLRGRSKKSKSRESGRPSSTRLQLEILEDRCVPSASFDVTALYPAGGNRTAAVAVADFNRDTVQDIASATGGGNNAVGVSLGINDGAFCDLVGYASGDMNGVATADFDGDGQMDVIAFDYYTHTIDLLHGNGDGSLEAPTVYGLADGPTAVAIADFNGDGRPDVAVGSSGNSVGVLLNDGAGGFLAPTNYPVGAWASAIAVGDFNGDGKPDLATASEDSNSISILLNNGAGFQPAVEFAAGLGATGIAVADLNGDGHADVVAVGGSAASVLIGDGNGGFSPAVTYATHYPVHSVAVGDFNLDGKPDLALGYGVTTNLLYGSSDGAYLIEEAINLGVTTLDGHGDGTFAYGSDTSVESVVFDTQWGDLDHLPPADTYYIGSLVVGDFDSNGTPDLALGDNLGDVAVLVSRNNPSYPTMNIGNASVTEGSNGNSNCAFTVTLTDPSTSPVTVHYATADGTAIAGEDYLAASGTLTFAPGETSKTINISVIGDRIDEFDETFSVALSSPTNANLGYSQAVGTIVDDDPPPSMVINDASIVEGNHGYTLLTFTVSLSTASEKPITINYATANGTATTADHDYAAQSGTLTFAPGETTKTITIYVYGDTKKEADETFAVNLSSATNATILDGTGIGTILNDDGRR
jgi:hypothetical protein